MKKYNRDFIKLQTLKELTNETFFDWDEYDYPDYDDSWYIDYDYLYEIEDNFLVKKYSRINSVRYRVGYSYKSVIDMKSFLSKERIRQEKIDSILQDIEDLSNTIGNILKSKGIQI